MKISSAFNVKANEPWKSLAAILVTTAMTVFSFMAVLAPASAVGSLTNYSATSTQAHSWGANAAPITFSVTMPTAANYVQARFYNASYVGSNPNCIAQASCPGLTVKANGTVLSGSQTVNEFLNATDPNFTAKNGSSNFAAGTVISFTIAANQLNIGNNVYIDFVSGISGTDIDSFRVNAPLSITVPATVTFNANDGSGSPATTTQTGSGSLALSANSFTRSGYSFAGWSTTSGGLVEYSDGATYSFSSSATLFAKWSAQARTVTFDANGGTGTMAAQSSAAAANLSSNTFTRSGYYFDGWNTAANGSGTDFANSASYDFVTNATMYAKWRAIPLAPSAVMSIQVPIGQPIADAPVALQADGLKDQTGYTVTVHSTPQIIDQGTIWSGRLNTTVRIPANLEAGWHRLVIEGTAADGTPWTETSYFKVTASGLLDATSDVIPAELAFTSAPDASGTITLSVLLLGAGVLLTAAGYRLRRRSVNAE